MKGTRLKTAHQQRVELFMVQAGQTIPHRPALPPIGVRQHRAKLIMEEALEAVEGLGFNLELGMGDNNEDLRITNRWLRYSPSQEGPNLEKIADGCADISVVSIGTLSACGIADHSVLVAVDTANLSKFEPPKCPACGDNLFNMSVGSQMICMNKQCANSRTYTPLEAGGRMIDGKWIKPLGFQHPDIASLIEKQSQEADWSKGF